MRYINHFNIAISLSVFLIILIGIFRPSGGSVDTGISREAFWYYKINAQPIYDLVLAGDSRVMCDLSPAIIESEIGLKTFNFGFNFAGYSEEYLDAVEEKLNASSDTKVILMGITPRSLTPLNVEVSAFAREANKKGYEVFKQKYLSDYLHPLRPISLSTTVSQLQGKRFYRNHYKDGFMSVELDPPNPHQDLPTYKKIFNGNVVDEALISTIYDRVNKWTNEGVLVLGFRPPTSPEIKEAELRSQFDEKGFIDRFRSVGGKWLSVEELAYLLADGSHVNATDVPKFTRDMATLIASELP